jgi:hypothetical protein
MQQDRVGRQGTQRTVVLEEEGEDVEGRDELAADSRSSGGG